MTCHAQIKPPKSADIIIPPQFHIDTRIPKIEETKEPIYPIISVILACVLFAFVLASCSIVEPMASAGGAAWSYKKFDSNDERVERLERRVRQLERWSVGN